MSQQPSAFSQLLDELPRASAHWRWDPLADEEHRWCAWLEDYPGRLFYGRSGEEALRRLVEDQKP